LRSDFLFGAQVANRFFNPNEQFCDGTGTPYAGGTLDFYASGTMLLRERENAAQLTAEINKAGVSNA
jgi:hypothetical protein